MTDPHHSRARGLLSAGAAAAFAAAVILAAWPSPLSADAESAALEKYHKPLDEALDKALAWLAKQQDDDGSFKGTAGPHRTAVTSLCVMAFLGKGHAPGLGPYGQVVNKGIDFVLAQQQPSGLLCGERNAHGAMYSHGISALMLSEVSGMVDPERQKKIDPALAKAVKLILAAQNVEKRKPQDRGGWRYQATSSDADISCTGWQIMALRSARNNGASVPKEAIEEAVQYVMRCQSKKDGGFAYQAGSGETGMARTGTALLCLELCGRHRDDATTRAGDWVLRNSSKQFGGQFFYYGLYYCSQGMFQLGDKYWEQFAANMYETMLKFQNSDGSWPQGSQNEQQAGPCYSTAMAVLAMSVSYRQLPIYQR